MSITHVKGELIQMAMHHEDPPIRTIWQPDYYQEDVQKPQPYSSGKLRNAVGWSWLMAGFASLGLWYSIYLGIAWLLVRLT